MTSESNFPTVFFEDFLAALRKVQDENRIHGNVEVFELRPSPDGAVHLGVSWPSIGTVPPEEAKKFAEEMERSGTAQAIRREPGNLRYEYWISLDDSETVPNAIYRSDM